MTGLKRYYRDAVEKLLEVNRLEPKKARAYLESIAYQLDERFPDSNQLVREQIAKASLIAIGYDNPIAVLRELDSAVEKYLKRNASFDLFDHITKPSLVNPGKFEDFEKELEFLLGGSQ